MSAGGSVRSWLESNGFDRFVELFEANEIDHEALRELTAEHLKELGLPLGPRVKLLKAIGQLRKSVATSAPGSEPRTDHSARGPAPTPGGSRKAIRANAERRQLTVLFCDLVGSTELSARLDPEEMREILRSYQDTVAGEVGRFEGHVAKFMGDGVLAYFGWPRAHEDAAERAVRAGLAIVRATAGLATPDGGALAARVGIATGLVVVSDLIGEGAAQEEAVVGETPNLAARLQALAAPGQVVVAEATRRLIGELFELERRGPQPLKGIGAPAVAFAVVAERPVASRFEARAGRPLPLVGREQELALLAERWRLVKAGEGPLIPGLFGGGSAQGRWDAGLCAG